MRLSLCGLLACCMTMLGETKTGLPRLDHLAPFLAEVIQHQRRLDGRAVYGVDYVCTTREWVRWFDAKGRLKSSETNTYDVYPGEPHSILVRTEHNGVPAAPARLEAERARAVKAMEDFLARKARLPQGEHDLCNTPGYHGMLVGVYGFLEHSAFFEVAADALEGRPMIRLSFRPRPGFKDPQGVLDHMQGQVWVDAADRVVAKATAWPAGARAADGLFFEMDDRKVFPDMWGQVYYRLNPSLRPDLFSRWLHDERFDFSFEVSGYQRFNVGKAQVGKVQMEATGH